MPTRDAVIVGVLAALLLFVALNLQAGWVYAVDALLIGLLIAGAFSSRLAVAGLTIERAVPSEAFEGETVPVTLTIMAPRWRRFFVEIVDFVPGLDPHSLFVPLVRPRRPLKLTYRTAARRRGVHTGGSLELRSGGLTAMFRASRRITAPATLVIYPRYWPLVSFPLPGRFPAPADVAVRTTRSGIEFHGVRDFRDGDSLRHVHWRSTARRGTLVVREFEDEARGGVTLVLDTRAPHSAEDPDGRFEDLVRAAASVAHYVTRSGRPVRIIAGLGPGVVDVTGGWTDACDCLARVNHTGMRSPDQLISAAGVPARGPVVLFTTDAAAVAPLARGDRAVVAVVAGSVSDEGHSSIAPVCILRAGEEIGPQLESFARTAVSAGAVGG